MFWSYLLELTQDFHPCDKGDRVVRFEDFDGFLATSRVSLFYTYKHFFYKHQLLPNQLIEKQVRWTSLNVTSPKIFFVYPYATLINPNSEVQGIIFTHTFIGFSDSTWSWINTINSLYPDLDWLLTFRVNNEWPWLWIVLQSSIIWKGKYTGPTGRRLGKLSSLKNTKEFWAKLGSKFINLMMKWIRR